METLLESHESQLVGGNSLAEIPTNHRVPVGSADVPDKIQTILERLTAIEHRLSVRPAIVRELLPLDRQRTPDMVAILAAIELQQSDRGASEFDLHMRTMHEMVERFGYPNETGAASGGASDVYWRYEVPPPEPDLPWEVSLAPA
ncbi:MAG: hypothetical protein GY926_18700 [bacterium]|nr:hypothetical protein [bacterium]